MDPYEALANAVILQAVRDYRIEVRYLKKHHLTPEIVRKAGEQRRTREAKTALDGKGHRKGRYEKMYDRLSGVYKQELEEFFLSEWFMLLSRADGKAILEKLREEVDTDEC